MISFYPQFHNRFQMGQQTSLNCRSSQKQDQHQIETTHANAIHIIKSRNAVPQEDSQLKSRRSTTTKTDLDPSFANSNASNKRTPSLLPQHQNLLKVSYSSFPNSDKSNNKYGQRPGKTLSQIVQSRYNSTMHFPKSQAVILIQSLVYALRYMHKYEYKHHDIYPTNVSYVKGIFKVTNPLLVNASSYALTQQRKRFSFLAPELISELLEDTQENEIHIEVMWKADIFAIGMIALEFCSLQPSAQCYDEENYSLVDRVIKERLVKVAKLYSPNIADCIAEMLRYQVDQRIGVQELANLVFLNSAQEKIEKQPEQRVPKPPQAHQQPPRAVYQNNPPHVQQQYIVLPPGQSLPPQAHITANKQVPLNPNTIAIPTPNYAYTHIGPNNQGLLSPTTLQNKLKVIELIHEKPLQEQESEGQPSSLHSNILPTYSYEPSVSPQRRTQDQFEYHQKYQVQQYHQQIQQPQRYTEVVSQQQQRYAQQPQKKYAFSTQTHLRRNEPPPLQLRSPQKQQQIKHYEQYSKPPTEKFSLPERDTLTKPSAPPQTYSQPQPRTAYVTSNRFLNKVDQNGQTLQQRVERILQMSRDLK